MSTLHYCRPTAVSYGFHASRAIELTIGVWRRLSREIELVGLKAAGGAALQAIECAVKNMIALFLIGVATGMIREAAHLITEMRRRIVVAYDAIHAENMKRLMAQEVEA